MNKQQILEKGAHCARNTLRERLMLSKLNNPFIVNLWGSLQDEQNLYLVDFSYFFCSSLFLFNEFLIIHPPSRSPSLPRSWT